MAKIGFVEEQKEELSIQDLIFKQNATILRISIFGDEKVGKTALLNQLIYKTFKMEGY
jgi:GTPase SAR1 family protein